MPRAHTQDLAFEDEVLGLPVAEHTFEAWVPPDVGTQIGVEQGEQALRHRLAA